ncbi:hypothetical protein FB566_3542 [Stackebrandtia endophytica]|uniref:Uncharacterized protein n=1 Tax=Stackebrandtia endophytica TaxID=1496996 RepID=A0A543AZE5_9ACTN|nr:hypothetical protein [Stackebrandtia endophytica]TQL77967.1 hypothetical protein FB566_3542 [Stackebrandtia endophytica]
MTETEQTERFPKRDDDGRIVSLVEMMLFVMILLLVGVLMLSAIDGLFWLLGFGEFGQISGWIAGLLAIFVFLDDFRAWKEFRVRWGVAPVALVLSTVAGLGVVSIMPEFWLPLYHGALGVTVFALIYTVLWFTGMRLMGEREI